jgi:hypothetical protein
VLAALATWRVTHLLAEEDGPGDVVVRLRARAGDGQLGSLMDCFYCLSIWVAVPFSVGLTRTRRADPLAWLALSGAACLLEQATRDPALDQAPLDPALDQAPRDPAPEQATSVPSRDPQIQSNQEVPPR